MTKFNATLSLSTLAAVGALMAMPLFAGSANAGATSDLMRCKFNTKQKVVDCCQRILHDQQKPQWLPGGEGNCAAATKCVGTYKSRQVAAIAYVPAKPRCFITIPNNPTTDGDTPRVRQRGGKI